MANNRSHRQHSGELEVQRRMNTPSEVADKVPYFVSSDMPEQHSEFFSGLSYLPLGTLDGLGRPWASVLVTKSNADTSIGINYQSNNTLRVSSRVNRDDPFIRSVIQNDESKEKPRFAGVGVDFSNRRRNKLAGKIDRVELDGNNTISLDLRSDEHLGNCPKYITIRSLVPHLREPKTVFDHFKSLDIPLPDYCRDHLEKISTVFLASKHELKSVDNVDDFSDMGINHRGGAMGFVRLYENTIQTKNEDQETTSLNTKTVSYLVLPDFSGNRFFQSLGNIHTDKEVGLVFPDFESGNVFYVTGDAENLFDDKARELMPRTSLITRIKITGAIFIEKALDLKLDSEEEFSPYNPPVRYLTSELNGIRNAEDRLKVNKRLSAKLVGITKVAESISTFSFELPEPISSPLPGGFAVFDFSQLLDDGYRHMNDENPQLLNEDYVRTWTISSAPSFNSKENKFNHISKFDITVKLKPKGLISTYLHQLKLPMEITNNGNVEVLLAGTGEGFSCFNSSENKGLDIPKSMLWVAGGVGVTPFMSMFDGILNISKLDSGFETDVILFFSGKSSDFDLMSKCFIGVESSLPDSVSISIIAYLTGVTTESRPQIESISKDIEETFNEVTVYERRIEVTDISDVTDLHNREAYLCGPDTLTTTVRNWLEDNGVSPKSLHQESFNF